MRALCGPEANGRRGRFGKSLSYRFTGIFGSDEDPKQYHMVQLRCIHVKGNPYNRRRPACIGAFERTDAQ